MKTGSYFPHDSNAKDDPKCMLLIDQLGLEGYGIFWILIETLRDQPGFSYPLNLVPILAKRYNTSKEKIETVILNFDLFHVNNDKFFYSESLINRMAEIATKKLKQSAGGKKGMLNRWKNNQLQLPEKQVKNNLVITDLENKNNLVITSKGKESKVKEKKNIYIPRVFYDLELEKIVNDNSDNASNYRLLVNFMFGKNELRRELTGVLSIRDQITFDQFCDIIASKTCDERIGELLLKMENDPKYYKTKKILYTTLKNWANGRFKK